MVQNTSFIGLPLEAAKRLLEQAGISNPTVIYTASPYQPSVRNDEDYRRSPEGEAAKLSETRVVRMDCNGQTLIVSRFLTAIYDTGKEADHD